MFTSHILGHLSCILSVTCNQVSWVKRSVTHQRVLSTCYMENTELDTSCREGPGYIRCLSFKWLTSLQSQLTWNGENIQHAKNAHAFNTRKQLSTCSGYFFEPVVRILLGGAFIFSCVDENAVCFLITRDRYHCWWECREKPSTSFSV